MLKLKTACTILVLSSIFTTTCNCGNDSKLPPPKQAAGGSAGSGGGWELGGTGGAGAEGGMGGEGGILIDGEVPTCLETND